MHRRLLLAALSLLLIRLALLLGLLPPWQQPDEHVHVAVVEMWRAHIRGDAVEDGRQAEILQSMAANGWWRHYTGGDPPDPLPTRFDAAVGEAGETIGVTVTRAAYPPLYYGGVALLLAPFGTRPVTADLSAMRILSVLLALVTLWVVWRATTGALGPLGGGAVTLLFALHPQVAVVSTAASPDGAVLLCGAMAFWMATRVLRAEQTTRSLAWVWVAALLASGVDRSGMPLLVAAAGLTWFVYTGRRGMAIAAGVAAAGLMALLVRGTLLPLPRTRTGEYVLEFHQRFFDTWWFAVGWLHYQAPSWWLVVAAVISALAVVGVCRRLAGDRAARPLMALAAGWLLVQAAAVYWAYYRPAVGPQGRYLFAMIAPALCLLVLGIEGVVPVAHRARALAALVVAFALLDALVQMLVTLPAYAY